MIDDRSQAIIGGVLDAVGEAIKTERAAIDRTIADLDGRLAAIGASLDAIEAQATRERLAARDAILAIRETGFAALSDVTARAAAIRDGKDGADGPPGPAGEPGPTGPPGINPAGGWERGKEYEPRDLVGWSDTSWIAKEATTDEPGTSDAWQLLVRQPRPGRPGPQGKPGPQGTDAPYLIDVKLAGRALHFVDSAGAVIRCDLSDLFVELRAFIAREIA
jgi:hypothetical protein